MSIINNALLQRIAKDTMLQIAHILTPGMSEKEIVEKTEKLLLENGAESFWYHNVGALVLVGEERTLSSVSGRDYEPSSTICLKDNDIVTLDLSPQIDNIWGDYARTIYMENGKALLEPEIPSSPLFRQFYEDEMALHNEMIRFARPNVTFHQLWEHMNIYLKSLGLTNMDFHGNLGHTIETESSARRYIEEGNHLTLGETGKPFTFEPHIRRGDSLYGIKRENIYVFDENDVPTAL